MATARRTSRTWLRPSSWLSRSSWRIASNGSPSRASTLSSIAWVTRIRDTQRLGLGRDEPVEGVLGPGDRALGRLLALHLARFFGSSPALATQPVVLDDVVGRLDDDGAGGVEAGPAGAAGDLVELAGLEHPLPRARRTW